MARAASTLGRDSISAENVVLGAPAGGLDLPFAPPPLQQEAFPGESELTEEERSRWLILHVSLPRTIMTQDLASGRDTEAELNDVLASMAWGTVDAETREFVVQSEDPSLDPPHESLISYAEYTTRSFPADRSMTDEAREENLRMAASLRKTFTEHGQPGMRFRSMFDQMVKSLTHSNKALCKAFDIKKVSLREADVPPDPGRSDAQNMMRLGRHQILPSFWMLLINLIKAGRRFSVVFRTFSEEQLGLLRQEYQAFCEGKHPAYSGQNKTQKPPLMNGEKGSKNYRLLDANVGYCSRTEGRFSFPNRIATEDAMRVEGVEPPAPAAAPVEGAEDAEGGVAEEAPPPPPSTAYSFPPFHAAYAGLQHQILGLEGGHSVAAIVDDLDYWEAHDRSSEAGKLLLVDHAGSLAETKVQHIFFDGHIQRETSFSVDVRDAVTGEPVSYKDANNIFFHRVDFFKAITDQEYFIRALEDAERTMSERVVGIRRIADVLAAEHEKPEVLKKIPPKEYLYRTVIPALMPALEACQRDRPADPIEYIAFYMLRHPKQYSKTLSR